ncbi:MAG: hypothetical protein EOP84_09635 [Verrucomicrobiaceae bacterium]|nr:MAG: hypothetical protein EOP84_09635 [Verrucomicrobiaceae bacterium]
MNNSLFSDRRANGLLNRVREDVSHLRDDIGQLLSHTTRKTLPNGARELADQAKSQFAAGSTYAAGRLRDGGAYAANRLRDLRSHPPTTRDSASVIGGVVVVGLLAYGIYALCKSSQAIREEAARLEDELT